MSLQDIIPVGRDVSDISTRELARHHQTGRHNGSSTQIIRMHFNCPQPSRGSHPAIARTLRYIPPATYPWHTHRPPNPSYPVSHGSISINTYLPTYCPPAGRNNAPNRLTTPRGFPLTRHCTPAPASSGQHRTWRHRELSQSSQRSDVLSPHLQHVQPRPGDFPGRRGQAGVVDDEPLELVGYCCGLAWAVDAMVSEWCLCGC